jgi:hypothetical protein
VAFMFVLETRVWTASQRIKAYPLLDLETPFRAEDPPIYFRETVELLKGPRITGVLGTRSWSGA